MLGEALAADAFERVRSLVAARAVTSPDFWSMADVLCLRLCDAVAHGTLSNEVDGVLRHCADLRERVASPSMWASVYDFVWFMIARPSALSADTFKAGQRLLRELAKYTGRSDGGI